MITIRRKKRLFEGETAAPAQGGDAAAQGGDAAAQGGQGTNYGEIPGKVNAFLATLFDNIKKACSWDAMTKTIPVLANEQDEKLKDSIGKLKTAAGEFFKVEIKADNADSIKAASEGYSKFITALTEFNTAAAKVAQEGGAAPAQGQQGQQAAPANGQQAAPAQGQQAAPAQGQQGQQAAPANGQQAAPAQ